MRSFIHYINTHRKGLFVALLFLSIVSLWCVSVLIAGEIPKKDEFSLAGHRAVIDDRSYIGTENIYFVAYGNNDLAQRVKIPMIGIEPVGVVNRNSIAISFDGDVVYGVFDSNQSIYKIKKYTNGTTTILGEYDKQGMEEAMKSFGKTDSLTFTDSVTQLGPVRVFNDDNFLFGIKSGSAMSFVPDIRFSLNYNRNILFVTKDGVEREVYAFNELSFPKARRYMRLERLSADGTLAVIKIGFRGDNDHPEVASTYAYDIANNKWALLTDKPYDRVLYLR